MNSYQKATEFGIEIYLDPHFSKKEPKKVCLTLEEAKLMLEALLRLPTEGNKAILKKTLIPLKERIEQAENCDAKE